VIPLILGLVSQVGAAVAVARGFRVLVEGRSSSGKASQTPMATGFLEPAEACVEYAYNQLGQRILDDRTMPNGIQLAHFTYNQRLELVKSKRQRACQPPEIHTYAYDLNHNRTAQDGVGYTNNLADQLLTAGTAHLSYNGAGQATDVANWDLTYNCSDQITGIQAPGKNIAYRYDAGGQRVSKSVNGVASHYLWDGGDIRKEYNADGSVKAEYFLGAGREGIKSGGQWYYYLGDIQGSTLMLTDAHGNPAATYDYTDYGETTQTSGSTALYNPFLYTGQEYDAETGLYHLRARHYSPGKGRFFARDPIGYAGGSNMYAYCAGDPINHSDPSGMLIRVETADGRTTEYSSLRRFTQDLLFDLLSEAPKITRLDFEGHGNSAFQGIQPWATNSPLGGIFTYGSRDNISVAIGNQSGAEDFIDLIKGRLSSNAMIYLYGCNTANGDNNLAQVLSSKLRGIKVRGNRSEITFIPGTSWREYGSGGKPIFYLNGSPQP